MSYDVLNVYGSFTQEEAEKRSKSNGHSMLPYTNRVPNVYVSMCKHKNCNASLCVTQHGIFGSAITNRCTPYLNHVITDEIIVKVKKLRAAGMSMSHTMRELGLSNTVVKKILGMIPIK